MNSCKKRTYVHPKNFSLKTVTEKQVRELLIESNDQAEVDKLLKERNMDGSYKSHLKGAGIFHLLNLSYFSRLRFRDVVCFFLKEYFNIRKT